MDRAEVFLSSVENLDLAVQRIPSVIPGVPPCAIAPDSAAGSDA